MRMQLLIPAMAMLAVLGARGAGAAGSDGAPASDGLKPGDVLDQKSAQRAEGLLPPEILKRLTHVGRVIVVGALDPAIPRHLGFEVAASVEEAVALAESIHGRDCAIAHVRQPAPARP